MYETPCDLYCGGVYLAEYSAYGTGLQRFKLLCALNAIADLVPTSSSDIVEAIEAQTDTLVEAIETGPTPGAAQTPAIRRVTANEVLATDTYGSISFYADPTNTTNPTVQGFTLLPGEGYNWAADAGRALTAVTLTASATAAIILSTVLK